MLLACIAIVIILAMLIYGVPRFQAFFAESGGELPGVTRFVLRASSLVKGRPVVFLPLAAVVMAGLVGLPLLVRRPVNRVIGAALAMALIGVLLGMVLSLYVPLLTLAGHIHE